MQAQSFTGKFNLILRRNLITRKFEAVDDSKLSTRWGASVGPTFWTFRYACQDIARRHRIIWTCMNHNSFKDPSKTKLAQIAIRTIRMNNRGVVRSDREPLITSEDIEPFHTTIFHRLEHPGMWEEFDMIEIQILVTIPIDETEGGCSNFEWPIRNVTNCVITVGLKTIYVEKDKICKKRNDDLKIREANDGLFKVYISDVSYKDVLMLVHFLYRKNARVNADNVKPLFIAAKRLGIKSVVEKCQTYLEKYPKRAFPYDENGEEDVLWEVNVPGEQGNAPEERVDVPKQEVHIPEEEIIVDENMILE